jgi:hypothetical protein
MFVIEQTPQKGVQRYEEVYISKFGDKIQGVLRVRTD